MKGTRVAGIYSADPETTPGATFFESITYREVLEKRLKVMDTTAISLCLDNRLPIIVFDVREPGNMRRVVLGERVGTKVTG
jgi:uridylate kinase